MQNEKSTTDEPTSRSADESRVVTLKTSGPVAPGASASASFKLETDADLVDVAPAMPGVRVTRVLGGASRIEIDGAALSAREALGPNGLRLSASNHVIAMLKNETDAPAVLEAFAALANEVAIPAEVVDRGEVHPLGPSVPASVVGRIAGTGAVRRAVSAAPTFAFPGGVMPQMIAPVDIDPKITVRVRINAWQESEVRNLIEHRMIVSTAVAASLWGEISSSAKRKPADLERGEEKQDRTITLPWGIAEQLRRALYGAMLSEEARACVRSALDENRKLVVETSLTPVRPGQMTNPFSAIAQPTA